ncbi:MAG TPA: carbohydrate kinase family protein [Thermoflexales bacterium]|nr:carbohydrate kinase family protein [Thermoflexales bacterium]
MKKVVCFGLVNPGQVFAVETYPAANTGAYVSAKWPFIGADSVMVARTLAGWGSAEVHVIGNALGDDAAGRAVIETLASEGIHPHLPLRAGLRTPEEVDIVDRAGHRTFFVEQSPIWDTAADADLAPLAGADLVYVDWYAYAGAARVMAAARAAGVPAYLNVDADPAQRNLIGDATWAQMSADGSHETRAALDAAHDAQALGPRAVIVTRGRDGALAWDGSRETVAPALDVAVRDAQGAGAAFSAAMIHALLRDWPIAPALRFATRAGSLKVAQRGLLERLPRDD